MKNLVNYLVIPLTIIIFATVTKWWYVLVIDGTDEILTGFPFPFVCRGFHTSGALQFFILEFVADLAVYFSGVYLIIYLIEKFIWKIRINKIIIMIFYGICGLILSLSGLMAFDPNNLFYLKRPFDIEKMDSGFKFTWQILDHPDYYKYHPEKKPLNREKQ